MKQKEINTFKRKYFDSGYKANQNVIRDDPNTTPEHRELLHRVCEWASTNKYIFYTRVFTKMGEIVDLIIPGLPRPMIEIRHSEKKKIKDYCSEYDKLRIFIDTDDIFRLL